MRVRVRVCARVRAFVLACVCMWVRDKHKVYGWFTETSGIPIHPLMGLVYWMSKILLI